LKNLLFIISLIILPFIGYSQARLVLNNDGYINIEDKAFLVIANGYTNAIEVTPTGGNIISEGEENVIKWNIKDNTGNYIVPYTNPSDVKIPLEVNITDAGNAGGSFILSTYRTGSDNLPFPVDVTNLNSLTLGASGASLFVIDRFWKIDYNSYTTKPGAELSFSYDYANEGTGNNTIDEASLQAQRFNEFLSDWELILFGWANITNKKVENVTVYPNASHKDWTLVQGSSALPITLLYFESDCENGQTLLNWSTASENDNDYFVIDKSTDGYNFHQIATVQGAGNSNALINYSYRDKTPNVSIVYYRLKQVNFSGKQQSFNIISANCSYDNNFIVNQELFGDNSLNFNIHTSTDESLSISLNDYSGRQIASKTTMVKEGSNQIEMNDLHLVRGIYLLNIVGERNHYAAKLFKK
jgi:hypothetical protein